MVFDIFLHEWWNSEMFQQTTSDYSLGYSTYSFSVVKKKDICNSSGFLNSFLNFILIMMNGW